MTPQAIEISNVVLNNDEESVTVTYTVPTDLDQDGNPSVYEVQFSLEDAPDPSTPSAEDNYAYYTSLITGV